MSTASAGSQSAAASRRKGPSALLGHEFTVAFDNPVKVSHFERQETVYIERCGVRPHIIASQVDMIPPKRRKLIQRLAMVGANGRWRPITVVPLGKAVQILTGRSRPVAGIHVAVNTARKRSLSRRTSPDLSHANA